MCGIVGIARLGTVDLYEKDRDVFLQLLHSGVVRGHHGTGVFSVDADGGARLVKTAGPPYMLMVAPEFSDFWTKIKEDKTHILIGHNRFATTGKKITKHAHPFLVGNIMMVHNGTLEFGTKLPKFKDFDVDSEALASAINEIGIEETIKNTTGAYSIVYWDKKNKTLNIIRNEERPLHICIDPPLSRLVIASEKEMLDWVLKRNYYELTGIKKMEVPANILWTFSLGSSDPVETPLAGKTRTYAYTGYSADYSNQEWDSISGRWIQKNQQSLFIPEDDSQKAVDAFFNGIGMGGKKKQEYLPVVVKDTKPPRKDQRLKEVYVNTKDYVSAAYFLSPDKTKSLKRGDKLCVVVNDHVPENSEKQQHVVIASHDDWPDCRFQFRVDQDGVLDSIFEAIVVEVTIQNFLEPGKNCKDSDTIVWVNAPRIVLDPKTLH